MRKLIPALAAILFMNMPMQFHAVCRQKDIGGLPVEINVLGGKNHVQGIALDREAGKMYFSFTTSFVVTDLHGNVLGSIDRIQGHLGAMVFNPEDRKVYESLECKDDEIGRGLSGFAKGRSLFYVAIIDVDRIDKAGIDVENTAIFKTVCVKDAVRDYRDSVMVRGRKLPHRYGCSGIDGVVIAPKIGKTSGKNFLYVAYGIYGDMARSDNDCQVLLRYDIKKLNKLAKPVRFGEFDETGPEKALDKIFINTGNTSYGVQNMAYDSSQHRLFMAVYKGKKPQYRNYSLFAVDFAMKPLKARLASLYPYDDSKHTFFPDIWNGGDCPGQVSNCHPELDSESFSAWNFKWGSTGICYVGGDLWYLSENYEDGDGRQACRAHLYRWTGGPEPFTRL